MIRSTCCVALVALATTAGAGCHKTTEVTADKNAPVKAADIDLQGTVNFVRDARAKNAVELEGRLNGTDGPRVDIDHDGTRDGLRVVEQRTGKKRTLEILAVPSSRPTDSPIIVAYVDLQPADGNRVDLVARYAEIVVDPPPPITIVVTPVQGTFVYALVIVDTPVIEYHIEHHKHHKWH